MPQLTMQQISDQASQHHQAGRLQEAEGLYHQILSLQPTHPGALHALGVIALQQGRHAVAVTLIRRAIALDPRFAEAHYHLGNALKKIGQTDEAIAAWRQAITINPEFPEACYNLASVLGEKGRFDEAINAYRQAIAARPNYIEAHSNLGVALEKKSRLDEAIAAWRQAISINPNLMITWVNLGKALKDIGQDEEAIAAFRRAVACAPSEFAPHFHLATALLRCGQWQEGWEEYEWRWQNSEMPKPRSFSKPRWSGQDLKGKSILLHTEQGLGDTIQFLRYVPLLAVRGANVILEVQPELKKIAERLAGVSCLVEQGQPLPLFGFHCPLLSLPLVFKTTVDSVPAEIPYLFPDPRQLDFWKNRLSISAPILKVALVWAGNHLHKKDRNRSIALSQFAPLAAVEGLQFYSLQKGEPAAQAANPPAGMRLIDWTNELVDFSDTAALIAHLDLVISVDTAVAHLAGAMGKPVCLLIPFMSDWRWLRNRDDSPWYPTMRLFRQSTAGDWAGVIRRVDEVLGDFRNKART